MITKCIRCGEVFTKDKWDTCPRCRQVENEQLDFMKNYILTNPYATMEELERVSGVARAEIMDYVRQGRLIMDSPALKITCEQCGTEITSGRFCRPCQQKLANQFAAVAESLKTKKAR